MKYRQLGRSGLTVSALGMGAMNLSFGTGSAVDERTGISVLHAALDRGINFFDTAQAYGPYTSEKLVGNALSTCRDASDDSSHHQRRPRQYRQAHGSRTSHGRSHQSGSVRRSRPGDNVAAEFSAHVVCGGSRDRL